MLKAHGEFALPKYVPANQFLNFEGRKFSKSKGWGIEQHDYLEEFKDFPNKEDALRYALIRNMPENRDSDFKWDDFIDFHDKELADNLGNFINRVIVLSNKYFDGTVPEVDIDLKEKLAEVRTLAERLTQELETFSFKAAVQTAMELSTYGNTYLQEVSPWKIFKAEPDSPVIKECLFICLQIVALLSVFVEPFIPFSAPKIRRLLGLPEAERGDWAKLLEHLSEGSAILPSGHKIGEPELLFAKIHDRKDHSRLEIVNRQKAKLEAILEAEKADEREPIKDTIQFDDFVKIDLRTGTITAAEKVKKADKLLKLSVDLGLEQRTVVSGIAKFYKPEDVVGQQVVLVANLAPRKLRGIESQGMILMAENEKGELVFVSPEDGFGNGFVVR
jgi:methionyl-tRNA synthetase